jgi:hypothetical protein
MVPPEAKEKWQEMNNHPCLGGVGGREKALTRGIANAYGANSPCG